MESGLKVYKLRVAKKLNEAALADLKSREIQAFFIEESEIRAVYCLVGSLSSLKTVNAEALETEILRLGKCIDF